MITYIILPDEKTTYHPIGALLLKQMHEKLVEIATEKEENWIGGLFSGQKKLEISQDSGSWDDAFGRCGKKYIL